MEGGKQDDLDWLMPRKPSPHPPSSRNNRSGGGGGGANRLLSPPLLPTLNRSFQFPVPEINPYYPNHRPNMHATMQNNTTDINNNNVVINPTYPDSNTYSSLYDVLLQNKLSQLSMSSPHLQQQQSQPPPAVGRYGSIPPANNTNNVSSNNFSNPNNYFAYVDHNSAASAGNNVRFSTTISYPTTQYNMGLDMNGNYLQQRFDSGVRGGGGVGGQFQPYGGWVDNVLNYNRDQELDYPRKNAFQPEMSYVLPFPNSNNNNLMYERSGNFLYGRNGKSFDNISSSGSSSHERCCQHQQQQRQNLSSIEDLRSKIFSSLEELRGNIFIVAKDQNGCRDLQKILGEVKPEEKEMIFFELRSHVRELMLDPVANYLAQKMFEVGNEEQITELLSLVIEDEHNLMAICLDMHGTRAMQKLLGHLTTPLQRSLVVSALRRITVTLTKSSNGHHVIEHCLKYFAAQDTTPILDVVAGNCLDIAMDKSGCCVLQQCVEHARGDARNRLVSEIISNALILSEHPYGNYVVQFLVGLRDQHITRDVLAQLAGNYVSLSMNKYGSNVVEKCMKESSDEQQAMQTIQEIIGSQSFLTVLQDPYGNYVAQSAFSLAKGSIRHAMMNLIQIHYSYLHSHPHGKRVLARARGSRQRV